MDFDRERLAYVFGEEALDTIEAYDLTDERDLSELVELYLPVPSGGSPSGARTALLTIAVSQILQDNPPATWRAVERMRVAGLDRQRVFSELVMVISEAVLETLSTEVPLNPAQLSAALDALPMPSAHDLAVDLIARVRAEPGTSLDDLVQRTTATAADGNRARTANSLIDRVVGQLIFGPLYLLMDDTVGVFHDAIAGRVFTHRLNDLERQLGVLSVAVDLAAFGRFDSVRLADGTELEQFSGEPGHLAWKGPDGWLDRFQPGDLLVVSAEFTPPSGDEPVDATVTITVAAHEPTMTDALASLVWEAYDDQSDGLPVSAEDLIVWLCHHHHDLFREPLPPLTDWCAAAHLDLDGSEVAHDDSVWRASMVAKRLHRVFEIVPEERWSIVLGNAVEVLDDPEASIDDLRESLGACAEPEALDVVAEIMIPELLVPEDEFERDGVGAPGHVFEFVQRALTLAHRPREVATAEYLACVMHERCGQPLIAAEHLARAAQARPRLGPVMERMGWYCFDRGDARGAAQWWRELDETHRGLEVLAPFLTPSGGRPKVGRNDPCWCRSGRKFKQCHQSAADGPALPDRVGWLCSKAVIWLDHAVGESRRMTSDLAIAWVTGEVDADTDHLADRDPEELRDQFVRAFTDPIVFDAALHEGGLFRRFLRERADLLPDDERLLATSWLTVDRSVHEVVSVDRNVGMQLRDLATGDIIEVRERSLSKLAQPGERYCARVVPDGASHQIIGGVFTVPVGHETTVLDMCGQGDPFQLCAWAGALVQPPRIEYRSGTSAD